MGTKFRVLQGKHAEHGYLYPKNSVVESESDLLKLNQPPASIKFEKLDDDYRPSSNDAQRIAIGVEAKAVEAKKEAAKFKSEAKSEAPKGPSTPSAPTPHAATTPAPTLTDKDYLAKLEKMNVNELRAHAAEEEVDLKGATTKEQMLKVLREAK